MAPLMMYDAFVFPCSFLLVFFCCFLRVSSTNEALCDGPVDPAAWDAIVEKIVAEGFGHQDVR